MASFFTSSSSVRWMGVRGGQCDQIAQFIGLWATFQSLVQQLVCLDLSHC